MRLSRLIGAASLSLLLVFSANAVEETKVEVKGVHLCCGACVKAVAAILNDIDGVQGKCDPKAKTITLTAKDDATAQKALDALAAGGFHGDTGNNDLKMKDDSGAEAGKTKTVTITGIHNCCPACCKAIKATVGKVEGVKAET